MAPGRRLVVALITALSLLFASSLGRPVAERVVRSERVIRVAPPVAPAIFALRAAFDALKTKHAPDHDGAALEFLPPAPFVGVAEAASIEVVRDAEPLVDAPDVELPLPNARGPPCV